MKILIILTLIIGINSCSAQSEYEEKLIGKWILINETSNWDESIEPLEEINPESVSDSITEPKEKLKEELITTLAFNKDKTIHVNQMGNKFNSIYKVTDSIMFIGSREYIIVEIDENKLIFKDKDGLFDKHYEYKRDE
ncbi:hypothetical protein JBL43_20035 [Aureibaculum sp. A20]|uniref:Lipocalin-like domain-containing protein n=1 Tax=Aureibaculum flavum TaxID=2795986 RepID=A0ABS0WX35_9FLAO|nr:hypothetical protein [Aureibaculum flavum]MBJ2176549.1 hypothetical protein [Aureibaculum flavum]